MLLRLAYGDGNILNETMCEYEQVLQITSGFVAHGLNLLVKVPKNCPKQLSPEEIQPWQRCFNFLNIDFEKLNFYDCLEYEAS